MKVEVRVRKIIMIKAERVGEGEISGRIWLG